MSSARSQDQLVGRSLGEFVVRERIGEGGFGAVYRATQAALDREAVVKVLHPDLHASGAATERFLREAKLASKLDHPYAAHIYAFGVEKDGQHWIAMELVRGTTLDEILRVQGPLTLERFTPLLDRICEVVHSAHEQGVVHRDLKPANVMVLARSGRLLPKLLDFGIAKGRDIEPPAPPPPYSGEPPDDPTLDDTVSAVAKDVGIESTMQVSTKDIAPIVSAALANLPVAANAGTAETMAPAPRAQTPPIGELTQQGAVMGSPHYMAPEQWLDAAEVDGRADLYALGILAYECLTGKPPYTGATVMQIATAHAKQAPPPLGPGFPAALDKVFSKVLAKRASERYTDALAFTSAFRQASGVTREPMRLPSLPASLREVTMHDAPQPIAEALAAYDGARNAHQARDALSVVARTIARYLGLLAVACRSRVTGDTKGTELLRALARRPLEDDEWIELARQLTTGWLARRDAYPIPELVGVFHDGETAAELSTLLGLRSATAPDEEALLALLEASLGKLKRVLEALAFFRDYAFVVTSAPGLGESWMGVRRTRRSTFAVRGKELEAGVPTLLDKDGAPVLSLAPLFQVASPTPGAPLELFMFDGRGRGGRGAKLVALPFGFEHTDETLWDWFRLQLGTFDEGQAVVVDEVVPYRGLAAFTAEDGAMFFGRETQVEAFANRLRMQPLLAVVGPSGAGKSSFVQAGVIPALPKGWRTITMRPGAAPIGALVARLEHANIAMRGKNLRTALDENKELLGAILRHDAIANGPIVLVIDQLEELFTLCQDDAERRVFAEAVATAARAAEDPVRVVFTLRDDFLVRTEQVPALRNRIGQGLQLLTVPLAEDLRRILVEPARRAGFDFEDAKLPDEMVAEVADQPGALALISFTALKLWEQRDRHFKQLTRAAYKTLGGVGGALAQHAEQTLDTMPPDERVLTREAFRHLVTSLDTRAVLGRDELRQLLGNDSAADTVIEKLVTARLLVARENEAGAETVEIVHEALLSAWPRLVDWRRDDREGARFREQLRTAAKQWDERERVRGLLWRGDAFGELMRWRARQTGPLTDLEAAFADASERDAARGRRNLRILIALGFAALSVVVVVLIVSRSRVAAEKAQTEVANDKLHGNLQRQWEAQGRLLVLEGDPLRALAALDHSAQLGAAGRGHDYLVAEAVNETDGLLHTLDHGVGVRAPHFSHDGTRAITGAMDNKARIWDTKTGQRLLELSHNGAITRTAFAPDDSTVLTASFDGTARMWDAKTGVSKKVFDHDGKNVWCALYSPDGKRVLTAGEDDTVMVWTAGATDAPLTVKGKGRGFTACAFSPDGQLFAAADAAGAVRIWRSDTGALVHDMVSEAKVIGDLSFSPDGTRMVTAGDEHAAVVWDVATGKAEHRLAHDDVLYSAAFSPDGKRVVTASLDRTASVWDAATGQHLFALTGHLGGITRAAFSPDGAYIATSSEDSTARLWDASGRPLATWWHDTLVFDFAFDEHGERAITASNDGTAVIWAVHRQGKAVTITAPGGTNCARLSADGNRVALGTSDGVTRVYDTHSGGLLAELKGDPQELIEGVGFDRSGRYVATASNKGAVKIWDTQNAKTPPRVLPQKTASTSDIEQLDWKGDLIVTGTDDGYLRVWNTESDKLVFEAAEPNGIGINNAQLTPNGQITALTFEGELQTWDASGKQLAKVKDPAKPWRVVYDPTGKRMVVLSDATRATEIRDLQPASAGPAVQLVGHLGHVTDAAWSPDGNLVATAALDGTIRVWDATTGEMLQILRRPTRLAFIEIGRDGRLLAAEDDGYTTILDLPALASRAQLDEALRCRVPFVVEDERVQLRARRDRASCN